MSDPRQPFTVIINGTDERGDCSAFLWHAFAESPAHARALAVDDLLRELFEEDEDGPVEIGEEDGDLAPWFMDSREELIGRAYVFAGYLEDLNPREG